MRISEVVAPGRSRVREIEEPRPGPGQVLVEVLACGVCTSDKRTWHDGGTDAEPVRLGHEVVGRIVERGAPDSSWRIGDVVTGLGGPGFAERVLLDRDSILRVPAGLDPALAIGEPLACLEEALGRCAIRPGARIAVVGLGFMGLGLLQLARRHAPAVLLGVDPNASAREHGLRNGADAVLHPDELPAYLGDSGDDRRMDVVLEATGVTPGLRTAGELVRPYGTLCVVGYHYAGTAPFDMGLWYKGATIVNGFSPDRRRTMRAMARALDLVREGVVDCGRLITHRFGLDEVDAAYRLMSEPTPDFVKSVIEPARRRGGPSA